MSQARKGDPVRRPRSARPVGDLAGDLYYCYCEIGRAPAGRQSTVCRLCHRPLADRLVFICGVPLLHEYAIARPALAATGTR